MGCERSLVLEMEVRVSLKFIIIIIIRLFIAITELEKDIKQYSINQCFCSGVKLVD